MCTYARNTRVDCHKSLLQDIVEEALAQGVWNAGASAVWEGARLDAPAEPPSLRLVRAALSQKYSRSESECACCPTEKIRSTPIIFTMLG